MNGGVQTVNNLGRGTFQLNAGTRATQNTDIDVGRDAHLGVLGEFCSPVRVLRNNNVCFLQTTTEEISILKRPYNRPQRKDIYQLPVFEEVQAPTGRSKKVVARGRSTTRQPVARAVPTVKKSKKTGKFHFDSIQLTIYSCHPCLGEGEILRNMIMYTLYAGRSAPGPLKFPEPQVEEPVAHRTRARTARKGRAEVVEEAAETPARAPAAAVPVRRSRQRTGAVRESHGAPSRRRATGRGRAAVPRHH